MKIFFRILRESVSQAWYQLLSNKLRTFLSLLGISIGIFCIISVQSAIDSLESNIRTSFEKLGNDIVYVSKMPWNEDPGLNYWKYFKRPSPNYDDLAAIKRQVKSAGLADLHVYLGAKTLKYLNNSVENVFAVAVTYDFAPMFSVEFDKGRYLTPGEYYQGANKVMIGYNVAEKLFGSVDPIGRSVSVAGTRATVVGVFRKSGKDIIRIMDFDNAVIIPFEMAKKLYDVKSPNFFGASLNVKLAAGHTLEELKDDLTVTLRKQRQLKPLEKDDFSLNESSILGKLLDGFFGVLNISGLFVGIFAIIVGMFSVANIMFVSVKERTNIIGIKKALGARKIFILLEFLIESIVLCIVGGAAGLLLVYITTEVVTATIDFDIFLSLKNILQGVALSFVVGILSGIIPSMLAARLDPVVAIRSGG